MFNELNEDNESSVLLFLTIDTSLCKVEGESSRLVVFSSMYCGGEGGVGQGWGILLLFGTLLSLFERVKFWAGESTFKLRHEL